MRQTYLFIVCGVGLALLAVRPFSAAQNFAVAQTAVAQTTAKSTSPDIIVPECRLKIRDERELAAERVGIIGEKFNLKQGDAVRAKSVVVWLKDDVARATYETASKKAENNIEVRYARKAKDVAYADWERAKDTNKINPGTIPEAEIDKLKLTAEKSDLQIEQAENQMVISELEAKEAKTQLDSFMVKTPIGGRVSRIYKEAGEAVQQGEAILKIVDTKFLLAEGYIHVSDRTRVLRGCAVTVESEGDLYKGHIVDVDDEATFVGERLKVFAEVRNAAVNANALQSRRLIAGLTATMTIHTDKTVPLEPFPVETGEVSSEGK